VYATNAAARNVEPSAITIRIMSKISNRVTAAAVLLIILAIILAGCNSEKKDVTTNADSPAGTTAKTPQAASPEQPAKGEVQIVIENFAFSPADVTVAAGTKVTWINKDDAPHTATSVDKKFNSGGLDTDDKFSFVFNDKGVYQYICTLHPQMKGTINVK